MEPGGSSATIDILIINSSDLTGYVICEMLHYNVGGINSMGCDIPLDREQMTQRHQLT